MAKVETQIVQLDPQQVTAILNQLSDIKSSLAVNTTETGNIKSSMSEMKGDLKEIKNDFVNRREFTEKLGEVNGTIDLLKKIVYGTIGTVGVAIIYAVLRLILK